MKAVLLIDSGNTRAKWQWLLEDQCISAGAGAIESISCPNEVAGLQVTAAVSCVAGMQDQIRNKLQQLGTQSIQFARTQAKHVDEFGQLVNSYAAPERMGVDRWLVMLGAQKLAQGQAFCVVDAGTAITVDAVDADGIHLGGTIAPGVTLLKAALQTGTKIDANWAGIELSEAWGTDTESALANGLLGSACGVIEHRVAQLKGGMNFSCILSGGDADLLKPRLGERWTVSPDLVFQGLRRSL